MALYFRTRGSAFYAAVLHGCVNAFLIWNFAASNVLRDWLTTLVWAMAAGVVVLAAGSRLGQGGPRRRVAPW